MTVAVALQRPTLKNTIEARATDDAVWLMCGAGEDDLVIEEHVDLLRALLPLLDGHRSREALIDTLEAERFDPADVATALDELAEIGLLFDAASLDALPPAAIRRAERQLVLLGRDAEDDPALAQRRLLGARVGLLGLGGFGSWAALGLASAGVGTLVGVDHDHVEASNLNRQVLFGASDVGRPKAAAAEAALSRLNPDVRFEAVARRVDSAETVAELVRGCDLVIDSIDDPPMLANRWVNEGCFAAGVPFLTISQQPPLIRVGPLYVPGRTGCYACVEARQRELYPLYGEIEGAQRLARQHASSGPASAAGAALAVHDALRFLVSGDAGTVGVAHRVDLHTLDTTHEPVMARSRCRTCEV